MSLALFDLDQTLLSGDSDYLWGQHLIEAGAVDRAHYERSNQRFYTEYENGTLDIDAFLRFALAPLAAYPLAQLHAWRDDFIERRIQPLISAKARAQLDSHRARGDTLVIITATNRFVTAPIAELLGVEHLLATEAEMVDGHYTGHAHGVPCFREGKVERLHAWLGADRTALDDAWFYSDSHNDLPLLSQVAHPVAVDPDPILHAHATAAGWSILSLRD